MIADPSPPSIKTKKLRESFTKSKIGWRISPRLCPGLMQEGGSQRRMVTVYETDGTNLAQVLVNPYVDHTRTISNDVCEILRVRVGRA